MNASAVFDYIIAPGLRPDSPSKIIDIRRTHGRKNGTNQRSGIESIRTLESTRFGRITEVETAKAGG